MTHEAKILQFRSKNRRRFRINGNQWNYFKTLFFLSLSFNILLIALFLSQKV